MNIISSVYMDDKLVREIRNEFPKYHFLEDLESFSFEQLRDAEVLVTYGNNLSNEMIDKMKNLKWIHIMQSGTNEIPFDILLERGIRVTNSKGINSVTIAEYALGMMLNLLRNSYVFYEAQKSKNWDLATNIDELAGKTIGILGFGSIGKEIAKRAKAFEMNVLAIRKTSSRDVPNVDEMLTFNDNIRIFSESDFIISLLPLTPETKDYVGERELKVMKKSAYIMNLSRGNIINQSALLNSLKRNEIAGAVLDVFEREPLPVNSVLWDLENVYITPHIAGDRHPSYMSRALNILLENTRIYQEKSGEMINVVNLNKGY